MFRKLVVAAIALVVSAAAVPAQAQCNKYDRSGCGRDWFGEAVYNLRSVPRNVIRDGQAARDEIGHHYARRRQGQYYDASYSRMAVPYDVPMGYSNMGHRYPFDACQYGRRGGCVDYKPIQILENGIAVWRIIETRKLRMEMERANDRADMETRRDIEEQDQPRRREPVTDVVTTKPNLVTYINMTPSGILRINGEPLQKNGHTLVDPDRRVYAESDIADCNETKVQINEHTIGVVCR